MEAYVLGIGILVTALFLTGIFYTIREFREMEKHPEDHHIEKDHMDISG